jgi:hypothetical protein
VKTKWEIFLMIAILVIISIVAILAGIMLLVFIMEELMKIILFL